MFAKHQQAQKGRQRGSHFSPGWVPTSSKAVVDPASFEVNGPSPHATFCARSPFTDSDRFLLSISGAKFHPNWEGDSAGAWVWDMPADENLSLELPFEAPLPDGHKFCVEQASQIIRAVPRTKWGVKISMTTAFQGCGLDRDDKDPFQRHSTLQCVDAIARATRAQYNDCGQPGELFTRGLHPCHIVSHHQNAEGLPDYGANGLCR